MDKVEEAFLKSHLFTKKELIKSFKLYIEYIKDNCKYTGKLKKNKLDLCQKFMLTLIKCKLPDLIEP